MRPRPSALIVASGLLWAGLAAAKQPQPANRLTLIPDERLDVTVAPGSQFDARTGLAVALFRVDHPVRRAEPEAMARQYLQEAGARLGIDGRALQDLRLRAALAHGAGTTVRLDQTYKGIPVYRADLAITVDFDPKVTYVASSFQPGVSLEDVAPRLGAGEARRKAAEYLGVEAAPAFERTDLVVYPGRASSRLAWRVVLEPSTAPTGSWEVLVDATSGQVFRSEDRACYATGSGQVFNNDPLASAHATYGDPGLADNSDGDTAQLTAQLQNVTLQDIDLTAGTYTLKGPWAEILDFEAPNKGLFTQAGSAFNFTRAPDNFEAVNTYFHIDTLMRYLNAPAPTGANLTLHPYQYAGGVQFDPSGLSGADNSHYLTASGRLAFGEGGVDDAEDADVVIHELGHGLHDWVTSGGLSQVQGLSEGVGDYIAQSYSRAQGQWAPADPAYHWVFGWDGHNPFWAGRVTNYAATYPGGLVGQVHTDGQIWATANMRIWNRIGRQRTDRVFFTGLAMTNGSTNQQAAAQAVIQASQTLGYTPAEQYAIYDEYRTTGYVVTPVPVELQGFTIE